MQAVPLVVVEQVAKPVGHAVQALLINEYPTEQPDYDGVKLHAETLVVQATHAAAELR